MFRQLDYQRRALNTFATYLDELRDARRNEEGIAALIKKNPELRLKSPDFSADAWEAMGKRNLLPHSRHAHLFSPRHDGCGRPVPNVVLKVPTGGGKTWLAISAVSQIMGRYLSSNTGLILWVVPNEAIYSQTIRNLKNRQHPYRQALDRAAAQCRVRILEKTDPLDIRDVNSHLCILMLMLQSANRETRDTLKIFQDRGDVHGFFPSEGDREAHRKVLDTTPNLDVYRSDLFAMIKDSLGNALRIIHPVVVLDEGHRAISDLAFRTLYGFNPCFVLELTATPRNAPLGGNGNRRPSRSANVLVEVTGRELDREGMIKMPLNLYPQQDEDWRTALHVAVTKLKALDAGAKKLRAETNRYIRPILLVQVERTGIDQRSSGHIHAEDVKEQLLTAGFDEHEVAIKTAERNDLRQPENQDLLSPTNCIRAIITKQALQEGWDCPFAYVLCSLAASSNLRAMTQLVGRILRQPDAMKTGVGGLDECHVITHHADTAHVVKAIKRGLERDGLGDITLNVAQEESSTGNGTIRSISRRSGLESTNIHLPKVIKVEDGEIRDLDYETDVLSLVDWRDFDPAGIVDEIPGNIQVLERQLRHIKLEPDESSTLVSETVLTVGAGALTFDPTYAARIISDIIPNPFVGRKIITRLLDTLEKRGIDTLKLGELGGLIMEEMRRKLTRERDAQAEDTFKREVATGRIQFRLRLDGHNWRMPEEIHTMEPANARQLVNATGGPLQRSLFSPIYENEMNAEERDIAVYLDGEAMLTWWHRNVARAQYGVQGWKQGKIYPDFIFAIRNEGGASRTVVLETKGDHLDNPDTAYKRNVLEFLSDNFAWNDATPSGELELVQKDGGIVQCALVLMGEWRKKLPNLIGESATAHPSSAK